MKNIFDRSEWEEICKYIYREAYEFRDLQYRGAGIRAQMEFKLEHIVEKSGLPLDLLFKYQPYYRLDRHDQLRAQLFDAIFTSEKLTVPMSEVKLPMIIGQNQGSIYLEGETNSITIYTPGADTPTIRIPLPAGTEAYFPDAKLVLLQTDYNNICERFIHGQVRAFPLAMSYIHPDFGDRFTELITMLKYSHPEDLVILGFEKHRDIVAKMIRNEAFDYAQHNGHATSDFFDIYKSMEPVINTMISDIVGTPNLIKYSTGKNSSHRNLFMKFTITHEQKTVFDV